MPLVEASIGLTDLGLLRGYGVFDNLRTYHRRPFLFDEHLARFRHSAKKVHLKVPYTDEEIKAFSNELLAINQFDESNIKFVLTGGLEGTDLPNFYILAPEFKKLPESCYTQGVKLISYNHERYLPTSKSTNYLTALSLRKWQKEEEAFEILYTTNGKVLEAATSNFFIFNNNKLITPREGVLFGITRNHLIRIAADIFQIEEREIAVRELEEATEAFITSTNKEIVPVVDIDGNKIADGKVGSKTKELLRIFRNSTY